MWAWWCWTPMAGRSRSAASLVERYSGWRSWATTSGDDAVEPAQVVDGLEEGPVGGQVLEVADVVAGDDARRRSVRATVFLSSAPTARTERRAAHGSGIGCGAKPRDRRRTCVPPVVAARTTESSQRMWMRAVVAQDPVDEAAEPGHGVVVRRGRWARRSGCRSSSPADGPRPRAAGGAAASTASIRPSSGRPGATPSATGGCTGPGGQDDRAGLARSSAPRRSLAELGQGPGRGQVGHHHGEGLVVAVLAPPELGDGRRVGGVDGEVEAAEALDRDDAARSQRADRGVEGGVALDGARRLAGPVEVQRRRGPHAGQALGWAWNRRSAGSSYSAWHRAHIVNPAMVVAGRS